VNNSRENTDLSILESLSVLYAEDDKDLRTQLHEYLGMLFKKVYPAENGEIGWEIFCEYAPDIVLTDIKMPKMDGLEMSGKIKEASPATPIIIATAFSEVKYLIRAIEIGIDRFVQKPINEDLFLNALYRCALPLLQKDRIRRLEGAIHSTLVKRLGKSQKIKEVITQIQQVAATDFSVVLQGETGVGKSLAAGIIHELSSRANQPFITIDVGSMPETLVESELFGYKRGAFTGAIKDKKGLLQMANGGTVLLDELENITPHVQAKLLHAVEEKKIYPVGSTKPIHINIRIISATNMNFLTIVEEKKFREDLYYRLFEFEITIPPLRERPEDISLLAHRFFSEAACELKKKCMDISKEALIILENYKWPGNIRELKNVIRRAVLVCKCDRITDRDILKILKPSNKDFVGVNRDSGPLLHNQLSKESSKHLPTSLSLEEIEKWAIRQALLQSGGKRMKAAAILEIDYKRLVRKMKKYGILIKKSN